MTLLQALTCIIYLGEKISAIFSATRSPSMAALIIPPAYPAPSPQGNKLLSCGCARDSSSRGMRTGDEVLDSVATTIASSVKYPFIFLPNAGKAF